MKLEDFEKTREELKEEKKKNNEQFYINDERTRMAKVNQFEYKAGVTLAFSLIGYTGLLLISGIAFHFIGVSTLTSIFPDFCYPIALLGSSLGIGMITQTLVVKKFKLKERLRAFSNARKQADLLEEEIKYQIELEKANARNRVHKNSLDVLNSNETILKTMSTKYELHEKHSLTKEEATQKITKLSAFIKEKYHELDLITAQKVLHDRFWRIRTSWGKIPDMIMVSMVGGAMMLMLSMFPIMIISNGMMSTFSRFITLWLPLIAGSVGTCGYIMKRNHNYKKAFDCLNAKLGEHALSETTQDSYFEQQTLNAQLENIIRDISIAFVEQKEEECILETIKTINQQTSEKVVKSYTPEEMKAQLQDELTSLSSMTEAGTQTDTTQEKGPVFTKKRQSIIPDNQKNKSTQE